MAHQFYFNPYILDNLPTPNSGFDVVQDLSEPRLRMYITSRGVKSFFVRKRVGGRDRRIIIGNYPDMDIEDARAAVGAVLDAAMRKPKQRRRKITFGEATSMYMRERVRRTEDGMAKLSHAVARHMDGLAQKNILDITTDDVRATLDAIAGAAIRQRMQELMQSIFSFAIECGYAKTNPVVCIPKVAQTRRVRPLTRTGVARLVSATDVEPSPILRASFLMLIYGFAPKSKVFAMRWDDLDFNHYMWGNMPLSDAAAVLLRDLPQQDDDWVFPSRGGMHITDPRASWRRVAAAAGIPNLTMDDVHKFMMRNLTWASDKEEVRDNMNALIEEILQIN